MEKIDFEDDAVFLEPLLFAYFNSKKDNLFSSNVLVETLSTTLKMVDDFLITNVEF